MKQTRTECGGTLRMCCRWGLFVGVLLWIEPTASFYVQEASRPQRKETTDSSGRTSSLYAVGIPLDDSVYWSPRRSRIHNVLEKAKRRTGLDSCVLQRGAPPAAAVPVSQASSQQQVLPFSLPVLSDAQKNALENEEIVIEQSEMGRMGSGFVVQDVMASEATIWDCLLDFEGYQRNIHTVRSARVRHSTARGYGTPSIARASFDVSRFQFTISAIFHYHPEFNYMELALDNAIQNTVLQSAKGYWYTERLDNNNKTRVWLLCDLTISPLLPKFVVDCAAQSAMPRASSWLRPTAAARLTQQSGRQEG